MTTRSTRRNKERLLEEVPIKSEPNASIEKPSRRQTRRHKENEVSEDEQALAGKFVKYPAQTPVKPSSAVGQRSPKRKRAVLKEKNETADENSSQDIIPHKPVELPASKKNVRRTRSKKNVSTESDSELNVQELSVKIAKVPILLESGGENNTAEEKDAKVSNLKDKKKSKRNKKNKVEAVSTPEFTSDSVIESDKPKTRKQELKHQESSLTSANTSADSFHSAAGSPIHAHTIQSSTHSENELDSTYKNNSANSTITFNKPLSEVKNGTFTPNKAPHTHKSKSSSPNILNELNSAVTYTEQKYSIGKYDNYTANKTRKKKDLKPNTTVTNLPSSSKDNGLNETFDKSPERRRSSRSSILSAAGKLSEDIFATSIVLIESLVDNSSTSVNGTKERAKFDSKSSIEKSKLNETFDKNNLNETFDKSPKISDANKRETINGSQKTTPILVREGTFTKETSKEITPTNLSIQNSLVREGTFTKETSSKSVTPKDQSVQGHTRLKKSISAPGSTPYHINNRKRTHSIEKSLTMLNITRSLEKEKSLRRSFTVVEATRQTKVMFCSPVLNLVRDTEHKSRIVKSSLKGSNKSFVYEEPTSTQPPSTRKRSYTHGDAENVAAKRKKLNDQLNESVNRLSRPKTATAGRTEPPLTPNNKPPLRKSVSETKPTSVRSKLPDFAALHKKAFQRMESLSECQERKARRARQILQFSSGKYSFDGRKSPIANTSFKQTVQLDGHEKKEHGKTKIARSVVRQPSQKDVECATNKNTQSDDLKKKEAGKTKIVKPVTRPAPTKQESTNGLSNKSYTRFGFKLNTDVNPFSIPPSKTNPLDIPTNKPKLVKQTTKERFNHTASNATKPSKNPPKPSLNGTVSGLPALRREKSKNALTREISATAVAERKKRENRDIIKGVRTNRRFELQMKSRNMN